MNEELYPELLNYTFRYCRAYFSENERKADWHLLALFKSNNGSNAHTYEFFMKALKGENIYDNKDIMELSSLGFQAFKIKVATRIFNEHKNELELNLCPKCGKIARTPNAKQCKFYLHDWH